MKTSFVAAVIMAAVASVSALAVTENINVPRAVVSTLRVYLLGHHC